MVGRILSRSAVLSGHQVGSLLHFPAHPKRLHPCSLAWAELRLTFSHVFRKFDMKLAGTRYVVVIHYKYTNANLKSSPAELKFFDAFTPHWIGDHVQAHLTPVTA
jgi:hypothetical protein